VRAVRPATASWNDDKVVQFTGSEGEASLKVIRLQIRKFLQDLLRGETRGKQLQNIGNSDSDPRMQGRPPRCSGLTVLRSGRGCIAPFYNVRRMVAIRQLGAIRERVLLFAIDRKWPRLEDMRHDCFRA
jgi:hypothetical protein